MESPLKIDSESSQKISPQVVELLNQQKIEIDYSQLKITQEQKQNSLNNTFNIDNALLYQAINFSQEESFNTQLKGRIKFNSVQKQYKYTIRYNSKFRSYWDLFIIILSIYNCIILPLEIGFTDIFYGTA